MKKILYFVFTLIALSLASCEMVEEITINKDGSGNLSYTYDMSKLMEIAPGNNNTNEKARDTTFNFSELLNNPKYKDSLKAMSVEERKILENLKDMTMRMKMNPEIKQMEIGFGWKFNKIDEITDIFNKFSEAQKLNKANKAGNPMADNPIFKGLSGENQNIIYQFNDNVFTRTVKMKKELTKQNIEEIDQMLGQDMGKDIDMKEFFGNMKYTIKLNFPKPIKSVNNKNTTFSNNKKSVSIIYKMDDFLKKPKTLDLEIELVD